MNRALAVALLALPLLTAATPLPATAHHRQAGADLPFVEENAATSPHPRTNGTILGPDHHYGTLAAEATGLTAVQLTGQGSYVSFRLTRPANAVDFHYALPDSLHGGGITAPLHLYVDGHAVTALDLTSQYSWLYGSYPFSNRPSVGKPDGQVPHDFYNDVRYRFDRTLPAGTVVKLQIDPGDNAPWYVVNTADFEQVAPPTPRPDGFTDVTQAPYRVDNTGTTDTTDALQHAIDALSATGQGVYLPPGRYLLSHPLDVDRVRITGAGEWYTELTGKNFGFAGKQDPPSTGVEITGLALFGHVGVRDDSNSQDTGFNGGFSDSHLSHVWIQNEKVGAWILGPSHGLRIDHLRIQDTTADGINLNAHAGPVTDTTVSDTFLRNTGDDGLALWSQNAPDSGITLAHNTVDSPVLANNVGVYGAGADITIRDNLLQDTVTRGGGIGIGQRFGSVPMTGPLRITGNTLVRTGQWDPGWDQGTGAIWFDAEQGDMTAPVELTGNTLLDSPFAAFQFKGDPYRVAGVRITDTTIRNVGTYVFQEQAPGSATVARTHASGVAVAGQYRCGDSFTLTDAGSNSGWKSTSCSMPANTPLWAYPGTTTFEAATVGTATPAQKVVLQNTGTAPHTLRRITASPGFTLSPDRDHPCGTQLDPASAADPGSWCVVDVAFTAGHEGTTTGSLTADGTTVQLVGSTDPLGGSGGDDPPNLALDATMTASSALAWFPATQAADDNDGSYWESQDGLPFPQTLTADLGTPTDESRIVLTLPATWGPRTQTIEVQGSLDGTTWTTLAPAADLLFDPATANHVTVALPAGTHQRYLRLVVTGNTGWSAAQLSEFQIFA